MGTVPPIAGMQNSELDAACIYDARCGIGVYSPLFNPMTYEPHKAYYAFTAFNELRKLGSAVKVSQSPTPGLWSAAARRGDRAALMLVNSSAKPVAVNCETPGFAVETCRLTDDTRTEAETALPPELPPHAICVVLLKAAK